MGAWSPDRLGSTIKRMLTSDQERDCCAGKNAEPAFAANGLTESAMTRGCLPPGHVMWPSLL